MGEENSNPKSDPENPNERVDAVGKHINAASVSAIGETTLDTSASGAAAAKAEDRMSIGPYVLLRILGEGGMGQVWLAEQTAPVKRQVALKLIKGGLYDSAVIQRFESERQSLAMMNHPAIAKVFDAGSTKDGQPYFVMEYVDGPPITRYCDNKKLKIRERLELFIKVCEGVQHAHQKAIIHRDLKPSNILVVEVDGKATPRIIDFGIAKAVSSQPGAEQTQFTEMGALIGTRGFISPEQADPNVLDVDTRTDVYSLGALLYVLLTGMLPFDSEGGKKKPIDELLRQLREEDPRSPSTKVSTEKETATAAAHRRGTEPKQLANLLRGDLDWITLKAVEKDRARRYGTPSELAADIERYLENRPVAARPASTWYRLKKYVQRHRLGVATASGAVALLAAFAVTEAVQLRRTTSERDRANRITDFMTNMFKQTDPSQARGNTITAREILDKASQEIDTGLAKDPGLQAQMMSVMGNVYSNLGLYSQAHSLLERSVEIHRDVFGLNSRSTLGSAYGLSVVLEKQRKNSEAESLARQTLEAQRRVLGQRNPDTLRTASLLGAILDDEARYAEAESLQRATLETQREVMGPEAKDTLGTMLGLAATLQQESQIPEAMKIYRQLLEIELRILGSDHPATLLTEANMSVALMDIGHYPEAMKLEESVFEADRRVYGPENSVTVNAKEDLAEIMIAGGQYAGGEKNLREVLDFRNRVEGPENEKTLVTTKELAFVLTQRGRSKEAEQLLRHGLEIANHSLGPTSRVTLMFMSELAGSLGDRNQFTEAESLLRRVREIQQRTLGDVPDTAVTTYNLACIEARMGRASEALALLRASVDHGLPPRADLTIETDTDLKSLHGDPRFAALVAHAKERAAAQEPK